jgi:phage FluMu protein Com
MMTGAKQMQCGGCGCVDFRLHTADAQARIAVECQQCKDVSYIQPAPAKLEIEWGEKSDGRLTV